MNAKTFGSFKLVEPVFVGGRSIGLFRKACKELMPMGVTIRFNRTKKNRNDLPMETICFCMIQKISADNVRVSWYDCVDEKEAAYEKFPNSNVGIMTNQEVVATLEYDEWVVTDALDNLVFVLCLVDDIMVPCLDIICIEHVYVIRCW
jgi:hypothetical protein